MLQKDLHAFILCYDIPYTGGLVLESLGQPKPLRAPIPVHLPLPPTSQVSIESRPHIPEKTPAPTHSRLFLSALNFSEPQISSPSLHMPNSSQASARSNPPIAPTAADVEEGSLKPSRSAQTSRRSTPDPEKATHDHGSMRSCPSSNTHSHHSTIIYEEEDEDEENSANDPNKHPVWILIFLSTLSPFLSAAITVYTLLTTLTILLLAPLCIFATRRPLRTQFTHFLIPPFHFQLSLIFSPYDTVDALPPSSIPTLIIVAVFAPFVAFGVSLAAWVAAGFWVFAKILGDPSVGGKDERNDGRAAVLGVRRFWEGWLIRGLR